MRNLNKIPIFDWFYEQGDVYLTILLSGSDLLEIPSSMHEKKVETFVVGNTPTPNLTYDEKGIEAPMRFGNNYFKCYFPWESIIMISGTNAVIQFATEEKRTPSPEKFPKTKYPLRKKKKSTRSRGHLRVIK